MRYLFLSGFLFLSVALTAQISLNQGNIIQEGYYKEISFEYVKGKIIIPATVNGKKGRYILDTGAPVVLFSDTNIPVYHRDTVIDANGTKSITKFVRVSSIFISGLIYKDTPAILADISGSILECYDVDGILGSNLFRYGAVKVDWKKRRVIIASSFKQFGLKRSNAIKLNINKIQSLPYVSLYANDGYIENVIIDTGDDSFFSISETDLKAGAQAKYLLNAVEYTSTGSNAISLHGTNKSNNGRKIVEIKTLKIDSLEFENIYDGSTLGTSSRIGMKLLERGNFVIDFKKGLFFWETIDPVKDYITASFGVDIINQGEKIIVGGVWIGSEAYRKGLKKGDEIVGVRGYSFSNKALCDVYTNLVSAKDELSEITFQIKSEGSSQINEVTLNKIKF